MSEVKVKDYMTRNVEVIHDTTTVREAIIKLIGSTHAGFPVINKDGILEGFITSKELLKLYSHQDVIIGLLIKKGTYTASPDMDIDDAARILFRWGLRDIPVIDENRKLIGIISNLDIVRSHFDRATPSKVTTILELIKIKYNIKNVDVVKQHVEVEKLKPTQWIIYKDELEGRKYELERGLTEPLIVIKRNDVMLLVDGHHRAIAARELGIKELMAFIIIFYMNEPLGLEKTATEKHVEKLDDIIIENTNHHPLVEITTRLLRQDNL
ncbi:MAG: CBS domain-containing protein [Candidatus Thermoplasmatota archaeon]|jgi:IMP dehydrogenase|nr:CBS domain-containing protein [Candidatus Thermoplasmatota archaeon]